jgi:hypothetical protein
MNLTLNNDSSNNTIVAVNQDHKKNNHAQKTPEISWENPSQPRGKPSNPLLILPREDPPTTTKP